MDADWLEAAAAAAASVVFLDPRGFGGECVLVSTRAFFSGGCNDAPPATAPRLLLAGSGGGTAATAPIPSKAREAIEELGDTAEDAAAVAAAEGSSDDEDEEAVRARECRGLRLFVDRVAAAAEDTGAAAAAARFVTGVVGVGAVGPKLSSAFATLAPPGLNDFVFAVEGAEDGRPKPSALEGVAGKAGVTSEAVVAPGKGADCAKCSGCLMDAVAALLRSASNVACSFARSACSPGCGLRARHQLSSRSLSNRSLNLAGADAAGVAAFAAVAC